MKRPAAILLFLIALCPAAAVAQPICEYPARWIWRGYWSCEYPAPVYYSPRTYYYPYRYYAPYAGGVYFGARGHYSGGHYGGGHYSGHSGGGHAGGGHSGGHR
jgi:hypothetical protein